MISFNCYDEGFKNGFADAKKNRSKRYTGFPKGKALLSSNCYNSYVKGYDEGYRKGAYEYHSGR